MSEGTEVLAQRAQRAGLGSFAAGDVSLGVAGV